MAKSEGKVVGSKNKAWVISVDMGYGHQRAAYPLKDIAYDRIITANSDKIITPKEKRTWLWFQSIYESMSKIDSFPIIGKTLRAAFEKIESISPYYPFRDLSKPNFGSLYMHRLIKKGFLKSLVEFTEEKKELPFVSTFFAPALAASHVDVSDVYCVVTDTDINRVWVPENPKSEKLYYLTPTEHSTKRLIAYGVPRENIFFTGFPLPKENMGEDLSILKKDLGERLANLDPNKIYFGRLKEVIKKQIPGAYKKNSKRPLTLTFVVGGAGAQRKIGAAILRSLKGKIIRHDIRVNLIAGTRVEIEEFFKSIVEELGLKKELGKYVNIFCSLDKKSHFSGFNQILRTTDVLWTKPSELVFYAALGIPLILTPPIGPHEILNQKWILRMGSGLSQEDPEFTNEWLFEWIEKGILAESAWEGFTEAPRFGTYNIEKVIFSKDKSKVKFRY
jgi:glycosyltransferase involved in cell wall biosynthesis